MKKLLAFAFMALGVASAHAAGQPTPLSMGIDRTQDPSPICVYRTSSGQCKTIGTIGSDGSWHVLLNAPSPSVPGGVVSTTCATHQFANGVGTGANGASPCAQPAAADVSGLAPSATTDTTNAANVTAGALHLGQMPLFASYKLYGTATTQLAGFAADGVAGLVGGARTKDLVSPQNASFGAVGWCIQDDANGLGCWGGYAEARRMPGATGYTQGYEIEVTNLSGVDAPGNDPFNYAPGSSAFGLIIGSGGECVLITCPDDTGTNRTPKTATAALNIVANTAQFWTGINFQSAAIIGNDGTDANMGTAYAVKLAHGQAMSWFGKLSSGASKELFSIGTLATAANGVPARLVYTDAGLDLQNYQNGSAIFRATVPGPAAVNGLQALGAVAGGGVQLNAIGADNNISLSVQAKGTGLALLGNSVGYGYFDASGNWLTSGKTIAPAFRETLTTPASATATCTPGDFTDDASFHYVCTGTNTWKRSALNTWGGAPALSAAGTSPSLSTGATDNSGTVTEGSTATGFTLTFGATYANPRDCVVSSPTATAFTSYSTSTTALTLANASGSGAKFTYHCSGS